MLGLAGCADPVWLLNPKNPASGLARVLPYGGGGFNRSAHSARPGILCFVFAELFDFSFCGATCSEEPSQISNKNHQVYQNCSKNDQGGSKKGPTSTKRAPSSPKGVPKSIKMCFGTPLGHRTRPRRKNDPPTGKWARPVWIFRAALGAPRADFGPQWVSQNHPKST